VGAAKGAQLLARRLLDAGIGHPRPPAGAGPAATQVTVVIPVRDRAVGLAATLRAVGAQAQVVIVDDGSRLPPRMDDTRVIRHDRARGPAAARNSGWRAARHDFVAFVDADCQPSPGWLAALLPHFADPAVGAVAPRVVSQPATGIPAALAAYEQHRSPLDLGRRPALVRPGGPVPYVPTAALVVRRQALLDTGGFDESLRYGEDVDLVWRLGKQGWRVRYEPAATAVHPPRTGFAPWLGQRYHYGRAAAPLAARPCRAVAPVVVSPWSAAAWALAATGQPIPGAALAIASTLAAAGRAGQDRATAGTLARLAAAGNLGTGAALATAIRRAWLPPAVILAGRAARGAVRAPAGTLGAALVLVPLVEWFRERPEGLGPLTWSALRLTDDLAYQTGLWAGVIQNRSPGALLPDW
jgi:mycofactocin system glycosyltransferase